MNKADAVRCLCKEKNVSVSELARRIGQSRQNLTNKLRRDTLSQVELKKIAEALGASYDQSFTLPGGDQFSIDS